jgi:hypothetical protein
VCARADVLRPAVAIAVAFVAEGPCGWVVEEPQDVAVWAAAAKVAVAEEGWRLDLKADAEEVV